MIVVVVLIIMIAGWVAIYLAMRGMVERTTEQLRRDFQGRIESLSAKIVSPERAAAPASASAVTEVPKAPAPVIAQAAAAPVAAPPKRREITPEMMAVIAAAVTTYLGKKVRVRSAKTLQTPYEGINPWAQQGRVIVQASHNLHLRGR